MHAQTRKRGSSFSLCKRINVAMNRKRQDTCCVREKVAKTSGRYVYGRKLAKKRHVKLRRFGSYGDARTVSLQGRQKGGWDIVVGERLLFPENFLPWGTVVIIGHAYLCQFGREVGRVVYLGKLNPAFDSCSGRYTFELDNKLHRILQYMYRERTVF